MRRSLVATCCLSLLAGCAPAPPPADAPAPVASHYGTLEPFVANAVYFVLTDRFVNGDESNDQRDQGGARRTFDIPLEPCDGVAGNIGYLGGDFQGLANNLDYIKGMGFDAVWITPIVDNPDEAFTGGTPPGCRSFLSDQGKTGYHGYWGVNFYEVDEHLPSPGMGFPDLADAMHARGMKLVLDIVGNHGSPAWTMTEEQPKFGKIFDRDGRLIADHQNLPPQRLDPANEPLHAFYNATGAVDAEAGSIFDGNLAQLADFDADNPAVLEYLAGAYEQWIGQGADAFRIDTIAWMPPAFWQKFTDRIRAGHPGFFMFGEAYDYDAGTIASHTWPGHGEVSVLDFPMKQAMDEVFGRTSAGYERLAPALYLEDGPYANPYELATFYDNHDMARMDASDEGFIDAHNWLFTARGFPVVYYGSETGFMRGRAEHAGNRNYYGQERIDAASRSAIFDNLRRIAQARRESVALQRGLQLTLELAGDRAAFYRVYQHEGERQSALVLLNKGDAPARFALGEDLQPGRWRNAFDGSEMGVEAGRSPELDVPAHGVAVWLLDAPVTDPALRERLDRLMSRRLRRTSDG